MQELKSKNNMLFGIILSLIILTSFAISGFTGLRTILGLVIIFLPFYLIFNNFELNQGEKAAFSFFAGIALFPSLVYWLGFIVPFRISIFVVFFALLAFAYLIRYLRR